MPARRFSLLGALILCAALLVAIAPAPAAPPTQVPGALARGSVTKRPYIVMIDNHPNAYPQTGMDRAAVVFEALAEFGITRFMAVYVPGITEDAPAIGPVRSARLYFVQWAMGFHGIYVHAGGSPQSLALAEKTTEIVNLDALRRNGSPYFTRSKKRSAPHNLFTSSASLAEAAKAFKASDYTDPEIGFLFKSDAPAAQPAAREINYFFLYKQDPAGWLYDQASNSYLRTRRGKAAIDSGTGQQLRTKNVVIIEVQERKIQNDPKGRIEQDVVGSGVGRLFIDGNDIAITWTKETPTSPLRFYLADGSEAQLNAGQVWIAAVPLIGNVSVK